MRDLDRGKRVVDVKCARWSAHRFRAYFIGLPLGLIPPCTDTIPPLKGRQFFPCMWVFPRGTTPNLKDIKMAITETLNEGLKRAYNIVVTAAELDATVEAKLKEAQPNIEIKGFRKGKVPMAMLRKQHGASVLGEAMQEAVDGAMNAHLEASGDRPAAQPEMKMTNEDWAEGQDVEVAVTYETLPAVPEVDFTKIKLTQMVVKAEEADITEALDNLAETAQDFEDKKAGSKAKDGDQVVINFLGKVDDVAFEGGQGDDYPLVLGSNSFIPGFEAQLVGAKAGDDVVVNVDFPGDYGAENLAGKAAVFRM